MSDPFSIDLNFFKDILVPIGATILGAFLGFYFAILQDRKRKATEREERRIDLLSAINDEVIQINETLPTANTQTWNTTTKTFDGKYFTISLFSYENAINSGNISFLTSLLQEKLGGLRDYIALYDFILKEIMSFHKTGFANNPLIDSQATHLIAERDDVIKNIKHLAKEVSDILKTESILDNHMEEKNSNSMNFPSNTTHSNDTVIDSHGTVLNGGENIRYLY